MPLQIPRAWVNYMQKENIILKVIEQLHDDGVVHSLMYDENNRIVGLNFNEVLNPTDLQNIANEVGDNLIVYNNEIMTETQHVDTIINLFWPEHCAANRVDIHSMNEFLKYYHESLDENLKHATLIVCQNERKENPFQAKVCTCCGKPYIGFGYTVSNLHPICYSCYSHHAVAEANKLFSSLGIHLTSL